MTDAPTPAGGPRGAERRERPGRRRRRWGRQAEAELNDQRVLDAAREVFAAQGSGAPVAAVARGAGVGMGSLYRRYGSKEELLQRLCELSMEQQIAAAEDALAADGDAWSALEAYVRRCVAFRSGALNPVAGTFPVTEEMIATSRRGQHLLRTLIERAQGEGSLRDDVNSVDVSRLIELFSRSQHAPPGDPDHEHTQRRLLALALDGLRARDASPLPGPPPSLRSYQARWAYGASCERP